MTSKELEASKECKTNNLDTFESDLQGMFKDLEKDYNGLDKILIRLKEIREEDDD